MVVGNVGGGDLEDVEEEVDASIEGRCELKGTIVGGGVRDSVGGEGGGMGGRDRPIGDGELELVDSAKCCCCFSSN